MGKALIAINAGSATLKFRAYGSDGKTLLARGMVDAVILPRSLHEDMQALWPAGYRGSEGKPRRSGFYLPKADPRQLGAPLDQAIRRCRAQAKGQDRS